MRFLSVLTLREHAIVKIAFVLHIIELHHKITQNANLFFCEVLIKTGVDAAGGNVWTCDESHDYELVFVCA